MIKEIKKVLKRYADREVNLSSEAAREMVAKEIEKEITILGQFSNGWYNKDSCDKDLK